MTKNFEMFELSKSFSLVSNEIFQIIGFCSIYFFICYFFIKLVKGIWTTFLGYWLGFSYKFKPGENAFAIITGGTDGIGYEYVRFFAEKGYNIFIISRNNKKLINVRKRILDEYPQCRNVIVHQADFKYTSIYDDIKNEINKLDKVEVLVNNVGISYEYPEYFTKMIDKSNWELIGDLHNINMLSCTRMNQIVLPLMQKKNKGCILNISSFSATYPCPLFSVYGSSKTFVDHLSRALNLENFRYNIVIQSVLPNFVSTKMTQMKTSLIVPSPRDYVRSQIRTVNLESRTYGHWLHKLQGFFQDCIINNLFNSYVNSIVVYLAIIITRKCVYNSLIKKKIFINSQQIA